MRHRAKGRQLSRTASHKKATMNNLATNLFKHGGIQTTVAKAKELRPFAERLITLARRGDLHARRLVEQARLLDDLRPGLDHRGLARGLVLDGPGHVPEGVQVLDLGTG